MTEALTEQSTVSISLMVVVGTIGVWILVKLTNLSRSVAALNGSVKELREKFEGTKPRDRRASHFEMRSWIEKARLANQAKYPEIIWPDFQSQDDEE